MDTEYWTISCGTAIRNGWSCRECRKDIMKGENIYVRDGRKLRLFYHERCFSGTADPRSQGNSSYREWKGTIADHAPCVKGRGKWSVSSYGYEGRNVFGSTSLLRPLASSKLPQRAAPANKNISGTPRSSSTPTTTTIPPPPSSASMESAAAAAPSKSCSNPLPSANKTSIPRHTGGGQVPRVNAQGDTVAARQRINPPMR